MTKNELQEYFNTKCCNPSLKMLSLKVQKAIAIWSLLNGYNIFEDGGGWSLHILTEDGNIDDESILFCLNQSIKDKNYIAEMISRLFLEFSEEERNIILSCYYPTDGEILTIDEIT